MYLKCFGNQLKTVHLQGPCSSRPCISRPCCNYLVIFFSSQILYSLKIFTITLWFCHFHNMYRRFHITRTGGRCVWISFWLCLRFWLWWFWLLNLKVEKILDCILDSVPSPSPSVKIQIMGGKVCLRCKGKTLLGVVNKHLKTKCLLTSANNLNF